MSDVVSQQLGRGVPLRLVLNALGPAVEVLHETQELDRSAHDVLLLDVNALAEARGCIVLANVVDTAGPEWDDLLGRLSEAGAVAVMVRRPRDGPGQLGSRRRAGPAIVAVDASMSWDQLYALLRSVLVSARPASPGSLATAPIGDLFTLANTIAGACGGAVAIEDPQRRVLAYSSLPGQEVDETRRLGILGRQVPPDPAYDDLYRRLIRQQSVIREQGQAELPRLAVAITSSGENLGSIWLIESEGRVSPDAASILRDAAQLAAVHLLRARAAEQLERDLRTDLVGGLFDRRLAGSHVSRQLGFPARTPCVVIAFDLGPPAEPVDLEQRDVGLERLADVVSLRLQGMQHGAVTARLGQAVYALVPVHTGDAAGAMSVSERIVRDARQVLRAPVHAAIGPVVTSLDEAPVSREQAQHLLTILNADPAAPAVAEVSSRLSQVVLKELAAFTRDHPWLLKGGLVAEMRAMDAERSTGYAETVSCFLASLGDTGLAARRLNVHTNTLRYRLRRISEIFGIDFDDPDAWLVLALETRLRREPRRS